MQVLPGSTTGGVICPGWSSKPNQIPPLPCTPTGQVPKVLVQPPSVGAQGGGYNAGIVRWLNWHPFFPDMAPPAKIPPMTGKRLCMTEGLLIDNQNVTYDRKGGLYEKPVSVKNVGA